MTRKPPTKAHQQPAADAKLRYRADIDGLRAIAVLCVVAFHAFPARLQGGFVGVDVFFVISGFLISSIIFSGLAQGTFRFSEFYVRRIKRIFPALVVLLASCYALGWFVLLAAEFQQLGKHVLGSAVFASNVVLWSEAGYFDASADLKPLLHLWSLGIEEQFYILWPLLAYLAFRRRIPLLTLILSIVAVSFAANLATIAAHPVATFYLPFTRFWELLAGCALARVDSTAAASRSRNTNNIMAFSGIALIVGAAVALDKNVAFPGWWALLPTAGAVLIIAAGSGAWFNRNVLARRWVVAVGLISYPLYLWHWPLLSFARILAITPPSRGLRIAAVLAGFVLAALTYKLVEKPIRHRPGLRTPVVLFLLAAVLAGVGAETLRRDGLPSRFPPLIGQIVNLNYDYKTDARAESCWLNKNQDFSEYAPSCLDKGQASRHQPLLFVWGDSHAARLYPGLKQLQQHASFRIAQYTRDACPPILGIAYPNCRSGNDRILETIRASQPDVVVLFSAWNHYEFRPEEMRHTLLALQQAGVASVVLIGPAPQWQVSLPRSILEAYQRDPLHRIPERLETGLAPGIADLDASMQQLPTQVPIPVRYVSAWKTLCTADGCLARVGDKPESITSWDYGHLTTAGAAYLARRLPIDFLGSTQAAAR